MPTTLDLDVAAVRAAYPTLKETAYFNTGTIGLMAEPVLEKYLANIAIHERRGMAMEGRFRQQIEVARERIAARINAHASEIALTGNATDGVAYVAAGLDWEPGDEMIMSNQEHPAMYLPAGYLTSRYGVVVRRYEVSPDPAESLANARALFTSRTKLFGTSHVTSGFGIRLPVKAMCAQAHELGALALVDGAHTFGVTAIDVRDIGCDFFASNGHKWLGGPKGTGFLYARQELMETLKPAYVGAGSNITYNVDTGIDLQPDGRRFEFGTRGFAIPGSIGLALDWFDQLGWEVISGRIEHLSTYLKRQLVEIPGVELRTPLEFQNSSGLTTFGMPGKDAAALQSRFDASRLYPRPTGPDSIRVSTALFNHETEIDRLVEIVRDFVS